MYITKFAKMIAYKIILAIMVRGGRREGAGRKSVWNNGETTAIRVPKVLAPLLLDIARRLDSGDTIEFETKSKLKKDSKVPKSETRIESVTNSNFDQIESVTNSNFGLTGVQLAKRLGSSEASVRRYRDGRAPLPLAEWSQVHDPEGLAWNYFEVKKRYFPIIELTEQVN